MHERLRSATRSRWFDAALAVAMLGIGVLELALFSEAQNAANDPHAPLVAAGFAATCFAVMARRRYPVGAGCAVAGLILIEGVVGDVEHNPAAMLLAPCVLAYAIGALSNIRASVAGMASMIALIEAGVLLDDGAWVPFLFLIAPWAGGRLVRSQQEIVAALQQRAQELEAEQNAYARLAVRRERARIARELHDVVSHNLAVMVVQAGAGRVAPPAAFDRAAGRFASIRRAGEHGLDELSRLADMLRSENETTGGADRLPHVDVLIEHARAAGLTVRAREPCADVQLPRDLEQAAYRIVQEALTNVVKHAPGATLTVRIAICADALEIDVWDDGGSGRSSDLDHSGSGIGLAGMDERVTALGGRLTAGADPAGGWRVTARLPAGAHGT
ncbi:MAG: ATP-binding protein [Solirubrobacteraceae bacterium]